jgi:hypothetical protein
MRTFETEYKSFQQRLFNLKTFVFLALFIFYTYLIFNFKLLIPLYSIIIELLLSVFFITYIIYKSKTNIHIITFDEKKILLEGETFNKKWKKSINILETEIILKSIGSRTGICGVIFYINFKNLKNTYTLNSFETYSDEKILEIFNEFKRLKEEKIIIDEKIILNRIQEKIEKCPFQ